MEKEFIPTRAAALERLSAFLPGAGQTYATRRNYDLGPGCHTNVSQLSPYLRCRLLTEEEVVTEVVARHGSAAAEKFVQEVFWRTYWKGWLELRPSIWRQYQRALNQAWNDVQTQSGLRARWEAACTGNTEIECFDVWAKELVTTGYLHNHARMWFASIWIFTLKLPWELGADFFLRHLLDGDPASNTLSWRWVAGIQTPGKTYLARTSNISKFTEGRFHPKWQLATEAPPMDGPPLPAPEHLPETDRPDPSLRTGLLLHEDDLSPSFILDRTAPVATAVLRPKANIGPLETSEAVVRFRTAAQDDVLTRWSDRLGPTTCVTDAQTVNAWARSAGLEQIVTAYAPTGPASNTLQHFVADKDAPRLCRMMRPYDALTWPHATKGFFSFKKNFPDFIFNLCGNTAS